MKALTRSAALLFMICSVSAAATDYITYIHFPDGDVELCPTSDFSIGFPQIDINVTACYPDLIFRDTFDAVSSPHQPLENPKL
jgi:hypothetical protein